MAKGSHLVQVVRGKLGNMVMYRIQNSNDKDKQGSRAYVAKINNPKTIGQASQRMVVSNIMANYKQLSSIIRRGFEGVRYGGMSFQKYLSLNMKDYNGAYVVKGTQQAIPFPATISQGSLTPISIMEFNGMDADAAKPFYKNTNHFVCDLVLPAAVGTASTIGEAWSAVLASNSGLRDGDQITFVQVSSLPNGSFVYRTKSLEINVNDETSSKGGLEFDDGEGTIVAQGDTNFAGVTLVDSATIKDEIIAAAGVIVSRDGTTGTYERSNCQLAIYGDNETLAQYFTAEALAAAQQSYMSSNSSAVDWPVQPESVDTGDEDSYVTNKTVYGLVNATLPETYPTESLRGRKVLIASIKRVDDKGDIHLLYRTKAGVKYVVSTKGVIEPLTIYDSQTGAVLSKGSGPIAISDCDLAGSGAVDWKQYYTRYGVL